MTKSNSFLNLLIRLCSEPLYDSAQLTRSILKDKNIFIHLNDFKLFLFDYVDFNKNRLEICK
ncbi:hypothetical protein BpHYR1_015187 [Brachionus plicatilis]|uniref:Uncharacterized protein n=1 Tax=Brachionus plicatilis TaxID=10195 RepID=A0A3M7PQK7_BRAPC|nr:hypothetical protein BpHYR1_015187 [Brachionus plicatilis]